MRILDHKICNQVIKIKILSLVFERPNLGVNLTILDKTASFQGQISQVWDSAPFLPRSQIFCPRNAKFGAGVPWFVAQKLKLGLKIPILMPARWISGWKSQTLAQSAEFYPKPSNFGLKALNFTLKFRICCSQLHFSSEMLFLGILRIKNVQFGAQNPHFPAEKKWIWGQKSPIFTWQPQILCWKPEFWAKTDKF